MFQRRFILSILSLQTLFVAGCTGRTGYDPTKDPLVNPATLSQPAPEDPASISRDEILIRHMPANPGTLNPIFFSTRYEDWVSSVLFEGPFAFDDAFNWYVRDRVVESHQWSEDQKSFTLKLRPGLEWHDGQPWTARDIQFSFEVITDTRVPITAVRQGTEEIEAVKALDELTVRYVFKRALPTNKWNMYFPILPEHIFGKKEERAKDPSLKSSPYYNRYNREVIIGNGPYRFVEWVPNDRIVVVRWKDYHGEKPHFKRQIFKFQKDMNVALLLFKKGELDEMELTSKQFATETNDAAFRKVGVKGLGRAWAMSFVGWNLRNNPFFGDRRVRQAMAHALNIPYLIRTIGFNLTTPCYGIFHPDSWMFNPDVKRFEYDPAAAAKLLDEAGWIVSEKDGWRYREIDGKPVKFEFSVMIPKESPVAPAIAAIFAQDLERLGVSLKQRVIEWAAFMEAMERHDFQAEMSGLGTGTDPYLSENLWHTDQHEKGRNYGGYSNKRVDELFELGRKELDPEKRKAQYQEIQKLIYEDQPQLFIWNRGITWAFHKRLRGVQFSPRGVFGFYPGVESWWVHRDDSLRVDAR